MVALLAAACFCASACGTDQADEASVDQPNAEGSERVTCPDPVDAADHVHRSLPTYDYQGSASPAQLADQVDEIVVGEVVGAGSDAEKLWMDLRDVEPVTGTFVGDEIRVSVHIAPMGRFEPGILEGLQVLAFLYGDGEGGLVASVEGLWLSCDRDDRAVPSQLEPFGEGWPTEPTFTEIIDLVVDPPNLVNGPVVRRSGMRDFKSVGRFIPVQLGRPTGVLALDGDCLALVAGDTHTPLIWPPDSTWVPEEDAVRLADGTTVAMGETFSPEGMFIPAYTVQYGLGDQAQEAVDTCAPVVADPEAPLLVIKGL